MRQQPGHDGVARTERALLGRRPQPGGIRRREDGRHRTCRNYATLAAGLQGRVSNATGRIRPGGSAPARNEYTDRIIGLLLGFPSRRTLPPPTPRRKQMNWNLILPQKLKGCLEQAARVSHKTVTLDTKIGVTETFGYLNLQLFFDGQREQIGANTHLDGVARPVHTVTEDLCYRIMDLAEKHRG